MNITWFKDGIKPGLATFYESNITLNKAASKYFEGYDFVLLGIDYQNKCVVIKPSEESSENSFRISIANSYSRITNKEFMKEIMKILDTSLTNALKFSTEWEKSEGVLLINLKNKEVQ